ncbi:MAG TPA: hypothetical protein VGX24_15205 [Pyrinomonadaceae bacterium]|jgi:hypothetical protein|nr:hypothetical protein [Pyrinomonadaceae bacterium]
MLVMPPNENKRRRAFVEIFRLASFAVSGALGCVESVLDDKPAATNTTTNGDK